MLSAAFTNMAKKRKLLPDFPFSSLPLQQIVKKKLLPNLNVQKFMNEDWRVLRD